MRQTACHAPDKRGFLALLPRLPGAYALENADTRRQPMDMQYQLKAGSYYLYDMH